jgi:hypothetical protein
VIIGRTVAVLDAQCRRVVEELKGLVGVEIERFVGSPAHLLIAIARKGTL